MKDTLENIRNLTGGIASLLLSIVGLLVITQVVFGEAAGMNVIGNLQGIVDGFVGEGASLAGVITLVLLFALLQKQSSSGKSK
jgi:hypothetical protein